MYRNNQPNMPTPIDLESFLWGITVFFKRGWRWLASGLLLGLGCATAYLIITPQQFEAKALFRGAKVLDEDLDKPAQLIERLKFPTFYEETQIKACEIDVENPVGDHALILSRRIVPIVVKGTDVLQVTYRARTNTLAAQCLAAVISRLIASQDKMAEAALSNAKQRLRLTQTQLLEADRLQSLMDKRSINALDVADSKFSQTVLLLSMTLSKKEDIARLREALLKQMADMEQPFTRAAGLVEPIYAPASAIFPKRLPTLMGGLCGGLVLGGLAFFVRRRCLVSSV